jgi:hypothetical protein
MASRGSRIQFDGHAESVEGLVHRVAGKVKLSEGKPRASIPRIGLDGVLEGDPSSLRIQQLGSEVADSLPQIRFVSGHSQFERPFEGAESLPPGALDLQDKPELVEVCGGSLRSR